MIRAIETRYKGCRFRSRLEARWAVYFDALGIKWQYEKEGYDLGGICYLPDFWLPQVEMWAEVKPEGYSLAEIGPHAKQREAWDKLILLTDGTGFPSLMLDGPPELKSYDAYEGDGGDDIPDYFDYVLTGGYLDEHRFFSCPGGPITADQFPDVARGVEAARRARFGT